MAKQPEVVPNFTGGRWVHPRVDGVLDVCNPSLGEVIARTPL